MRKSSDRNNPEQKTRTASRNLDTEFGEEYNPVKKAKKNYEEQGQPIKSKQRHEQ